MQKQSYIPLLIAAGGRGRGRDSGDHGNTESSTEALDHDLSVPGLNGMSGAAGKTTAVK